MLADDETLLPERELLNVMDGREYNSAGSYESGQPGRNEGNALSVPCFSNQQK